MARAWLLVAQILHVSLVSIIKLLSDLKGCEQVSPYSSPFHGEQIQGQ